MQGFFIIVPPEYESLQSLPPEQFIDGLMSYLKTPYYVGLISAAQFYGAAHQKPQTFQVIIPKRKVLLDPQEKPKDTPLNSRWHLIINTELEIEKDDTKKFYY